MAKCNGIAERQNVGKEVGNDFIRHTFNFIQRIHHLCSWYTWHNLFSTWV